MVMTRAVFVLLSMTHGGPRMKKNVQGMHGGKNRKARGRGAINPGDPNTRTRPNHEVTLKTQADRPVGTGTKHRGDRRDMSKTYSGTAKHASRGSNPRADVKTRKR